MEKFYLLLKKEREIKMEIKSKEETQKMLERMKEEIDLANLESQIQDNKIEFEHKGKKYRVRLLNLKEKTELNELRLRKYTKLLRDQDILTEAALIKVYEERGIKISELDDKAEKLGAEIRDLQLKLGEALANNNGESILIGYKEKIEILNLQRQILLAQKEQYLSVSLENQLLGHVAEFITYLSLDIYEEYKEIGTDTPIAGKWVRLFNSYEDFHNYEDGDLLTKAGYRSMMLQYF